MESTLKEKALDYAIILNIIENLHRKKELNEKKYNYSKVLLNQEFGVFYN